jgi:hypothetical protein
VMPQWNDRAFYRGSFKMERPGASSSEGTLLFVKRLPGGRNDGELDQHEFIDFDDILFTEDGLFAGKRSYHPFLKAWWQFC